jgi:hypothetical protein
MGGPGVVGADAPGMSFGILYREFAAAVVGVLEFVDDFAAGGVRRPYPRPGR